MRVAGWRLESAVRSRRRRAGSPAAAPPGGSPGSPAGDAAPSFDLRGYHPVGWPRAHDGRIGSLGPPRLLPPSPRALGAVREVAGAGLRHLRRLHHVRDAAGFHADADRRAALLARLAAAGVLVHAADESPELRARLEPGLYSRLRTDPAAFEDSRRELHAAALRRAALRLHSGWARAGLGGGAPPLPRVSILLPTRRPEHLDWALSQAAGQTYPETELVLGLHGTGFESFDLRGARLPPDTQVLRIPAERTLGGALRVMSAAAAGPLLAKMDDDDLYGPDHLWDLVLAREFSGADLVGKWPEYLFLAREDRTIQWWNGESERYQRTVVAGGALLLSARTLAAVGGWRDIPRGVDRALADDVRRAGRKTYRTHGAGYLLVRHGAGHTWDDGDSSDRRLLERADRVWAGFDPSRAGIAPPVRIHPALGGPRRPAAPGPPRKAAAGNGLPRPAGAAGAAGADGLLPPAARAAAARGYRLARRAGRFALRTDRRLGARYLADADEPKLHLGCGGHLLAGWLNTDLHPRSPSVLRLDAASRYPFPSAAFRQVYSEHLIEHLPLPAAAAMLEECRRVLVPGGRIRVATPDLAFLLGLAEGSPSPGPERREESRRLADRYAAWQSDQLGLPGPKGFVVNAFLRHWGYRFIYDRETLEWLLSKCGFRSVVECGLDESGESALRGLAHSERLPPGFLALETLTLEAERPLEPPSA